jgi:hypothetical protein
MLELGALLGSLIAGTLSERISRTGGICVACGQFPHSLDSQFRAYSYVPYNSHLLPWIRFSMLGDSP